MRIVSFSFWIIVVIFFSVLLLLISLVLIFFIGSTAFGDQLAQVLVHELLLAGLKIFEVVHYVLELVSFSCVFDLVSHDEVL